MVLGQTVLDTGANFKKIGAAFPDLVTAKANTSKIVLSANKVSAYVTQTNESNILATASIMKKIYRSIVVNKQNRHCHQILNNFQHLKEIYLN